MRSFIFIGVLLITVSQGLIAQKSFGKIEVTPYYSWSQYPQFTYSVNSVTSNTVKTRGQSWGVNAVYKSSVHTFNFKVGFGYYKYPFDKIDQTNSLGGRSNNRIINYIPDGAVPSITYTTDKYSYNTFSVIFGLEKPIVFYKGVQIAAGIDLHNFFTFSQYYHITHPHPEGFNLKLYNFRYFGILANACSSLQKKFNKISIGPTLIVPVFSSWKQDELFPQETNYGNRSKWLKGVAVGLACTFYLTKT
jgi:hypothetical protein